MNRASRQLWDNVVYTARVQRNLGQSFFRGFTGCPHFTYGSLLPLSSLQSFRLPPLYNKCAGAYELKIFSYLSFLCLLFFTFIDKKFDRYVQCHEVCILFYKKWHFSWLFALQKLFIKFSNYAFKYQSVVKINVYCMND